MGLVADPNQLGSDPRSSTTPNAAFENVIDAQLMPDLIHRFVGVLVRHGAGSRDHAEFLRVDFSNVGNGFFRKPVAKVLLLRIVTEVCERQYRQHHALLTGCGI
jgi:hypothetical protein